MRSITKLLAAGAAIAAFGAAAPATAQYYPGYGYGYGTYPGYGYGGAVGSIVNGVTGNYGYGYGNRGYGYNMPGGSQVAANQCSAAVQQRLGYGGYGYGGGYGQNVRVSSVEVRSGGGYRVRGVAAAGGYGYGGGAVSFSCRTDPRGLVVDVDLGGPARGYGYNGYNGYGSNYDNPYEAYGYHRY